MIASVLLPVRTVSESNRREHWAKRHKRVSGQRSAARMYLRTEREPPALVFGDVVVLLTRVAPRRLDDDNLRGALKAVRDGVADWLGHDDADPRVHWEYEQVRGEPKQYAVRIDVTRVSDSAA